jgi:hypothetical protein
MIFIKKEPFRLIIKSLKNRKKSLFSITSALNKKGFYLYL